MGLVYLFALVAGLGILLVQVAMGAKSHDADHAEDQGDAHDHDPQLTGAGAEHGIVGMFLSTRFWVFAMLGFGLSGSLLTHLTSVGPILSAAVAFGAGWCSGLFAALAFRIVRKNSVSSTSRASQAVGRVGRMIVACPKGGSGKVRIEIGGQAVDFIAESEESIDRGVAVLIEDMDGAVAHVSRRPADLA